MKNNVEVAFIWATMCISSSSSFGLLRFYVWSLMKVLAGVHRFMTAAVITANERLQMRCKDQRKPDVVGHLFACLLL